MEGTIPDAHLDPESRPTDNKPIPRSSPVFAHAITHARMRHTHMCMHTATRVCTPA